MTKNQNYFLKKIQKIESTIKNQETTISCSIHMVIICNLFSVEILEKIYIIVFHKHYYK